MEKIADIKARYRAAHERLWGKPKPKRRSQALSPPSPPSPPKKPPGALSQILMEVAAKHNTTSIMIKSSHTWKNINQARFEYYFRAASETTASTVLIGKIVNRDHSTVMHGIRAYAHRNNLPHPRPTQEKWRYED